ncbi:MAG: M56 family metallopeptidase [Gemmatimonadota bacterium]|nr:M56 family metallopeptidase [Gemmatimonadota bacterium]
MVDFLEGLGSVSVWAFWAPVLVWTGLAGVAVLVLARMRGLHPIAGYRLRQALLLALPVGVLAAPWVPGLLPAGPASVGPVPSVNGAAMAPSVADGVALAADGGRGVDIAMALLGAATVAIVLLAIWRLAILATDLRQLRRLRQVAVRVDDAAPRRQLRKLAEQTGVRRPMELLEGPPDSAPMTFGAWRPVIMIPRSVLGSPDSLDGVLVHELVHIRRADYTWALLDCLVSAALAFHPLVWFLRRGIERCRETSCDAEVLARGFVRPKPYAELLAHTHTPTQFPMPAVAASLSAPSLKLKERLEIMKNFADQSLTSRQHVGIVLGAGLVCVVVAVAGACATRTEEKHGECGGGAYEESLETRPLPWKAILASEACINIAGPSAVDLETPLTVRPQVLEERGDYVSAVRSIIVDPLRAKLDGMTTIAFDLDAGGTILDPRVVRSSGNEAMDDAIRALVATLDLTPAETASGPVAVKMEFAVALSPTR